MTDTTASKILTAETVPAYLAEHASQLKGIFPEGATLTASAILGGNVNYAFCVQAEGDSSQQVFVKQAPEFVAIFGPDGFPLTSERMQQEMDAYAEWNTLLGEELSAKYLPKMYFFDSKYE
jgi:5-methylthioribose kinase